MRVAITILLISVACACKNKSVSSKMETENNEIVSVPLSAKSLKDSILGKWHDVTSNDLTMDISASTINHLGLVTVTYSLIGNKVVSYNPDETIDTMQVRFRGDTLECVYQEGGQLYIRF